MDSLPGLRCCSAPLIMATIFVACGTDLSAFDSPPDLIFPQPTEVSTSQSFTQVGLGQTHTCMLTVFGEAFCWGSNEDGKMGTTATMQRCGDQDIPCTATPARVTGDLTFSLIDGSTRHTCGLATDGRIWCWGFGLGGQLGDGRRSSSSQPVLVSGGLIFTELDVGIGGLVTCGLARDGSAHCWGPGDAGGLGNGTVDGSDRPIQVATSLRFTTIAVGENHACGLVTQGDAYCWGHNTFGKLGTGVGGTQLVPALVAGGQNFNSIVAGSQHTCALTDAGRAFCWGSGSSLGNGSSTESSVPVPVSGNRAFVSIHAGSQHTCALDASGNAFCWGPGSGAIGDGTTVDRLEPVAVTGSFQYSVLAAGGVHTCGIATNGLAYCWGSNSFGEIGQTD